MARAVAIVLALGAQEEAVEPLVLAHGVEALAPAGEELVDVALMRRRRRRTCPSACRRRGAARWSARRRRDSARGGRRRSWGFPRRGRGSIRREFPARAAAGRVSARALTSAGELMVGRMGWDMVGWKSWCSSIVQNRLSDRSERRGSRLHAAWRFCPPVQIRRARASPAALRVMISMRCSASLSRSSQTLHELACPPRSGR